MIRDCEWGQNSVLNHAWIQEFSSGGGGGGVQVNLAKSSDNVVFFLVLTLFYRSQMVNFKESYHFSRFQMGSNFFQGESNCDFPGGGGGQDPLSPPPPSGSALVNHHKILFNCKGCQPFKTCRWRA